MQNQTTAAPQGCGPVTAGHLKAGEYAERRNIDPGAIPPPIHIIQTVDQMAAEIPALTIGMIRQLLFHRATNGLQESGAVVRVVRVVRVGRCLLLERDRFLRWLMEQGQKEA